MWCQIFFLPAFCFWSNLFTITRPTLQEKLEFSYRDPFVNDFSDSSRIPCKAYVARCGGTYARLRPYHAYARKTCLRTLIVLTLDSALLAVLLNKCLGDWSFRTLHFTVRYVDHIIHIHRDRSLSLLTFRATVRMTHYFLRNALTLDIAHMSVPLNERLGHWSFGTSHCTLMYVVLTASHTHPVLSLFRRRSSISHPPRFYDHAYWYNPPHSVLYPPPSAPSTTRVQPALASAIHRIIQSCFVVILVLQPAF